jgi:outer membrane protein assembly factor BamB
MRKLGCAVSALALGFTLGGCFGWTQPGFNAGRTKWNSNEKTLTAANVGSVEKLWEASVQTDLGGSPPISSGGKVFVAGNEWISAVDGKTGAVVWSGAFGAIRPDLAMSDGDLIASCCADASEVSEAIRIDPDAGTLLGADREDGFVVTGSLAVAGGDVALFREEFDFRPFPPFRLQSQVSWKYDAAVPTPAFAGRNFAIVGDRVLWSLDDDTGSYALGFSSACPAYPDPEQDGCAPDWATPLEGAISAEPVAVGNDSVAYSTNDGIAVLDVATGAVRWTTTPGATSYSSPAVAKDKILAANTNGEVAAFPAHGCGSATCAPLWQGSVTSFGAPTVVAAGDLLYVPVGTQLFVFAIDGCGAAVCDPVATIDVLTSINRMIVDDGRIIVQGGPGLVAYGLPT